MGLEQSGNRLVKGGQLKIQQMVFMILGVFIFFVLVGLFFINFRMGSLATEAQNLQTEQALTALKSISNMPELGCNSGEEYCLDEDKISIMSREISETYSDFWPVASIKVYKIYPAFNSQIECPAPNCNYYEIYDSGEEDLVEYSAYVSICKKINDDGYVYSKCDIGKILLGVENV